MQLTNLISQETLWWSLSMNLIMIFCIFFVPRDLKWISYDFLYFFVVILTSVSSLLSQKDKAWFCLNSKIFKKKSLVWKSFFIIMKQSRQFSSNNYTLNKVIFCNNLINCNYLDLFYEGGCPSRNRKMSDQGQLGLVRTCE